MQPYRLAFALDGLPGFNLSTPMICLATVLAVFPRLGRISVAGVPFTGIGQFKLALVDASGPTSYWSNNGGSNGSVTQIIA